MHLSDRLMAAVPGPASSPAFGTGSSQAFGFSVFSHPSQNRFCRGTGANPSKLIELAFLLSSTEVFAEVFQFLTPAFFRAWACWLSAAIRGVLEPVSSAEGQCWGQAGPVPHHPAQELLRQGHGRGLRAPLQLSPSAGGCRAWFEPWDVL